VLEIDQATIDRLERQAKDNPAAYKRNLFFLALLGYCYVALVVVGLLVGTVLMIGLLAVLHAYVLIKFAFLLLGAVGLILKSMWVKYEPPKGFELKRDQVPKLFELIDEVRHKSGGPHVHKVLLDTDFNCAVTQFPRLGIFGFYQNYVLLGLPLLDSLSVAEFKSVLAHEMGHLSAQHGVFGRWIYHVKASWLQTYINLTVNARPGSAPIKKFASWFVPKFELHSLAICREQELVADQISGEICGPTVAAKALVRVDIKSGFLDREFWPNILKDVRKTPEPTSDIFYGLRDVAHRPIESNTTLEILQSSWRTHNPLDSHPSLSERVVALQPKKDWSNLKALSDELSNEQNGGPTSAEVLFGNQLKSITDELSNKWKEVVLPRWKMENELFSRNKKMLEDLVNEIGKTAPTEEQSADLSALAIATMESDEAVAFITPLYKLYPNDAHINANLGISLLGSDSEQGIPLIENAMKSKPIYGVDGNRQIAHYFFKHGKQQDAQTYAERSQEFAERLNKARIKASALTLEDIFEEHKETPEAVAEVCNALYADPRIKEAYLVSKVLDEMVGNQPVLVVRLNQPIWATNSLQFAHKVINDLAQYIGLPGCRIVAWISVKKNLAQAVQIIDGAFIYDRKSFHYDPDSKQYQNTVITLKKKAAIQPTFFVRNRTNIILASVIIGCLAGLVSTWKTPQRSLNQPSLSELRQAHYANNNTYMRALQYAIKHNWHPPRVNQSQRSVVAFKVSTAGEISDIHIKDSTGNEEMDQSAIAAVKRIAPFAQLPAGDPAKVDVEITLDYKVKQPQ
jgi:TonB family protein